MPFKGRIFFSSLAVSGDWVKKGSYRTAWSVHPGDFLRVPVRTRMGMAQLSVHTRESGVGYCSRGCGGLSLP